MMEDNFKRDFFSFINTRTLVFVFLMTTLFVLLAITQFSTNRSRFYNISTSAIKNFSFHKFLELNYKSEIKFDKLIIPNKIIMSESEIFSESERESNLPLVYWSQWKKLVNNNPTLLKENITVCDIELPSPHLLKFNNLYWQEMFVNNKLTLYLYNAYYDNREQIKRVKLITATNYQKETDHLNLWCLLWFDNIKRPVISKVSKIYSLWPTYWDFGREDGVYGPQLISCDIPNEIEHLIPKAISLITNNSCNNKLDHNLRVIYNKPEIKEQFGVCVQAFRFATYDFSVRLIEWLEILKILGANKVYFYKFAAHENMEKVLNYYTKQGLVDSKPLTLPNIQPNVKHLFQWYFDQIGGKFWPQELLELNDCLYRNLYRYEYIAIFDIDEIIIPQNAYNWSQLMQEIKQSIGDEKKIREMGYYENINTYVYGKLETDNKNIDKYLYTMRHIYRKEFTEAGSNIKCFHDPRNVEAVHNHFPIKCLGRDGYHNCPGHEISTKQSYLMHFRTEKDYPEKCMKQDKKDCAIKDIVMWKYYKELDPNMKFALKNIFK